MKRFFILAAILFASAAYSQSMNQTIQPGCFYKTTAGLFNNADSSYRPAYYTGVRCVCKGIGAALGCDSGIVYVHPAYNTDSTVRFPVKISADDVGYPIPFIFDKIFKIGTTIPLDSIWYFPDIGK
jgi:hypothetical protein